MHILSTYFFNSRIVEAFGFEVASEMPERGTPLYNWQKTQLSNGHFSLNANIRKEIAENEGSTVWSERRVKLSDCVEQKNCTKIGNA